MEDFLKKYKGILVFMFIYWILCLIMFFQDIDFLYLMLAWNVFLAVLPLLFIYKAYISMERYKPIHQFLWVGLWLFFFPNSLYMVTDFIHISGDKFMWLVEVERYSNVSPVVYGQDILIWAKLLIIGLGFLFSILVGLESLNIFQDIVRDRFSKALSYLAILLVSILSSIGIYIGRFLRFNSWDIVFNPFQLIKLLISEANFFTLGFIGIFTVFTLSSYILYRIYRFEP